MATKFHSGELTVSDLMADLPAGVPRNTPLAEVARALAGSSFQHVLVTNDDGTLAGVISSSELLQQIANGSDDDRTAWEQRPVETVMNTQFIASSPDASASDISPLLSSSSVECVPVLEGDSLVGVLTREDLLISWNRLSPILHNSAVDPVTDLANRATFDRRLEEEWERTKRQGQPVCVILFDVDHFKDVNDTCGHLTGDAILRSVAACLVRQLRNYDVVARFGGDEFAAICCDCESSSLEVPIIRLQDAVRSMSVQTGLGRRSVTLSIGAASMSGERRDATALDLVAAADECLYASKTRGRDCAHRTDLAGGTGDHKHFLVGAPVIEPVGAAG